MSYDETSARSRASSEAKSTPEPVYVIKVTIGLSTLASDPEIDLNADDDANPFYIIVRARIKYSVNPSSPVALEGSPYLNPESVLETSENPFFLDLVSSPDATDRSSPDNTIKRLALGRVPIRRCTRGALPRDLREIPGFYFYTIHPNDVLEVKHRLPRKNILTRMGATRDDPPRAGERYKITVNTGLDILAGEQWDNVWHTWYRWGDLEVDLKGKKFDCFCNPRIGMQPETGPEWVQGECDEEMTLEVDGEGEFTIVDTCTGASC